MIELSDHVKYILNFEPQSIVFYNLELAARGKAIRDMKYGKHEDTFTIDDEIYRIDDVQFFSVMPHRVMFYISD